MTILREDAHGLPQVEEPPVVHPLPHLQLRLQRAPEFLPTRGGRVGQRPAQQACRRNPVLVRLQLQDAVGLPHAGQVEALELRGLLPPEELIRQRQPVLVLAGAGAAAAAATLGGGSRKRQEERGQAGPPHAAGAPCIYIYIYVYMYIFISIYLSLSLYIYIYIYIYIHTYLYVYLWGAERPAGAALEADRPPTAFAA